MMMIVPSFLTKFCWQIRFQWLISIICHIHMKCLHKSWIGSSNGLNSNFSNGERNLNGEWKGWTLEICFCVWNLLKICLWNWIPFLLKSDDDNHFFKNGERISWFETEKSEKVMEGDGEGVKLMTDISFLSSFFCDSSILQFSSSSSSLPLIVKSEEFSPLSPLCVAELSEFCPVLEKL